MAHAILRRGGGEALADLLRPVLALSIQPAPSVVEAAARSRQERREAGAPLLQHRRRGYATARSLRLPS